MLHWMGRQDNRPIGPWVISNALSIAPRLGTIKSHERASLRRFYAVKSSHHHRLHGFPRDSFGRVF